MTYVSLTCAASGSAAARSTSRAMLRIFEVFMASLSGAVGLDYCDGHAGMRDFAPSDCTEDVSRDKRHGSLAIHGLPERQQPAAGWLGSVPYALHYRP